MSDAILLVAAIVTIMAETLNIVIKYNQQRSLITNAISKIIFHFKMVLPLLSLISLQTFLFIWPGTFLIYIVLVLYMIYIYFFITEQAPLRRIDVFEMTLLLVLTMFTILFSFINRIITIIETLTKTLTKTL